MLNRHGLVAGATGTGKTKTLQLIAEQLSVQGVPVFLADIKGDVSGISAPGVSNDKVLARAVGGPPGGRRPPARPSLRARRHGHGHPRTGDGHQLRPGAALQGAPAEPDPGAVARPDLPLRRPEGSEPFDLKDLRAVTFLTSDEGKAELKGIGGLSPATAGVILRSLTAFEAQGMSPFFGEPEFDTSELLRTASDGRGTVSVLELPEVQDKPQLFSTFLMWMLAIPSTTCRRSVTSTSDSFFFDEAHLFTGASKAFLESITQTVRLIRSKGVGALRDADPEGRAVRRPRPARQPRPARVLARLHPGRPEGAEGHGEDLPQLRVRPGGGSPHRHGHRRGRGDRAEREGRADAGRGDPAAGPAVPDGPCGPLALDRAVQASPLYGRYAQAVDRESAY